MSEWMDSIQQLFIHWLPNPWIKGSLWILAGSVLSLFSTFFLKSLHKLGATRTTNKFDDLVTERLRTPLRWTILFVFIYFGVQELPIDKIWAEIIYSIELTFATLLWGLFFHRIIKYLLRVNAASETKNSFVQTRTLPLFENIIAITLFATGIYFILVAWDINVGPLIASAGILGLALSLAAKDTMANLFAGVFIMADSPYKIGDYIVLDTGERGKVTHIGIRSTRILTRDDVEVTVPNAIMGNTKIINESSGPYEKFRIRIAVGVAYGTDIQLVRQVLMEVANNNQDIVKDPEPRVRFRSFGDSALQFELLCWVPFPELRGRISDGLNEQVYNAFRMNQIKIPFPQRELYIHQTNRGSDSSS